MGKYTVISITMWALTTIVLYALLVAPLGCSTPYRHWPTDEHYQTIPAEDR